jgi:hypothetical protein
LSYERNLELIEAAKRQTEVECMTSQDGPERCSKAAREERMMPQDGPERRNKAARENN